MYIYSSIPSYYPGTDVQIGEVDIRVHPAGDDQRMWGVQFFSFNEHWHNTPNSHEVLALIEKNDPSAWGEMVRAA